MWNKYNKEIILHSTILIIYSYILLYSCFLAFYIIFVCACRAIDFYYFWCALSPQPSISSSINIINSNLIQFNNLVSYVVSKYIQKKNVNSNFIFELGQVNGNSKLIKVFFKNIISVLLSGIIKFQIKSFPNTFDIKLFLTIIINIIFETNTYNLHDIKFDGFVNSVLKLNKLEDIIATDSQ